MQRYLFQLATQLTVAAYSATDCSLTVLSKSVDVDLQDITRRTLIGVAEPSVISRQAKKTVRETVRLIMIIRSHGEQTPSI